MTLLFYCYSFFYLHCGHLKMHVMCLVLGLCSEKFMARISLRPTRPKYYFEPELLGMAGFYD